MPRNYKPGSNRSPATAASAASNLTRRSVHELARTLDVCSGARSVLASNEARVVRSGRVFSFGLGTGGLLEMLDSALVLPRIDQVVPSRAVVRVLRERDARVVLVEGGTLGPDPRQLLEVVSRWRATGRPLQRAAPAPWIVHAHQRCSAVRLVDVVEERQGRGPEDE